MLTHPVPLSNLCFFFLIVSLRIGHGAQRPLHCVAQLQRCSPRRLCVRSRASGRSGGRRRAIPGCFCCGVPESDDVVLAAGDEAVFAEADGDAADLRVHRRQRC
ncbi:hypothetical protein DQ04_05711050, partial [Trypanosoma grayi]|uniref:hypothetical protein n=1 Tax=Trypanosoma grayi TaxID=71804 RepID=UPI0004F43795